MNYAPPSHRVPVAGSVESATGKAIGEAARWDLQLPAQPKGVVLLVRSQREAASAEEDYLIHCLRENAMAVLPLSVAEDGSEEAAQVAQRLIQTAQWVRRDPRVQNLPVGCLAFGLAGTAALQVAGSVRAAMDALVVVDSQPDLASDRLASILAATLLVVRDKRSLSCRINQLAYRRLHCRKALEVLSASPTARADSLRDLATLLSRWFKRHLHRHKGNSLQVSPA